jgi:hypothetical protein
MFGISLVFFLPGTFAHYGRVTAFIAWAFGLEFKFDVVDGEYGIRLRLLGIQLGFEIHSTSTKPVTVHSPHVEEQQAAMQELLEKLRAAGGKTVNIAADGSETVLSGENDEETSNNMPKLSENDRLWVKKTMDTGIKLVIPALEAYDSKDNSFRLPEAVGEMLVSIGDTIAFGKHDDHLYAKVTGSRQCEDGDTIFFCKKVKV